MLFKMLERGEKIDHAVFCDTGMEWPEMYRHISLCEEKLKDEIKIERIQYHNFEELLEKYGWGTMKVRWCTSCLKRDSLKRWLRENNIKDYVILEGIATDEKDRIKDGKRYPLVEMGMSEKDCLKYCYSLGFNWEGLYEAKTRVSCWCCPLQSLDDLRFLYYNKPELWAELKRLDSASSKNFRLDYSVANLEKRFQLEESFSGNIRSREFFKLLKEMLK